MGQRRYSWPQIATAPYAANRGVVGAFHGVQHQTVASLSWSGCQQPFLFQGAPTGSAHSVRHTRSAPHESPGLDQEVRQPASPARDRSGAEQLVRSSSHAQRINLPADPDATHKLDTGNPARGSIRAPDGHWHPRTA